MERSLFANLSPISHLISILVNLFLETEKHFYKKRPCGYKQPCKGHTYFNSSNHKQESSPSVPIIIHSYKERAKIASAVHIHRVSAQSICCHSFIAQVSFSHLL